MSPSIITISRQFGSGVRQIGAESVDRLNIPFSASPRISLNGRRTGRIGFSPLCIKQAPGAGLWPLDDQIYPAQVWTIQELEGSYTIVGRGANRVLEGYEDLLNLFICTAPNIRLKRVEEGYGVPAAQAEKLLDSADKNCAPYLKHDTGQAFGVAENCYLCIDSGKPGIENAVKIIEASYHTLS